MSDIQTPSSVELFREIADAVIARFVYVTDGKQYGMPEHWRPLREVNGKLAGDCEDFCITIAERCDAAGVPASDLTLHLVQIERAPDHVVIACGDLVADCNERRLKRRVEDFYFKWVSERNLASGVWVNS